MKSVMAEAATISKAVEEAWKKAGNPIEFFTKIVEEPKAGFLGFGAKNAIIALFFKKESIKSEADKSAKPEVVRQESYVGFFNNKNLTVEAASGKPVQNKEAATKSQPQQSQNQRRREPNSASSNVNPNQNRNQNRNQNQGQGQNKNQNQGQSRQNNDAAVKPVRDNSEQRDARQQRPQNQPVNRNQNQNNNQNRNDQNKNSQNNKRRDGSALPSKEASKEDN